MNQNNNFIKVGRIYWIKPKALPGYESKERPAIALSKYDKGKTIFLQIGTTNFKEKSSVLATKIVIDSLKKDYSNLIDLDLDKSHLHLDISKPEWNTSLIKPHFDNCGYVDIEHKTLDKVRKIYFSRRVEVERVRMKSAKIAIINENFEEAKKQLTMLKDLQPIKHKDLNIDDFIKKWNI